MSGPAKSVRALVGPRPNCSLYSFTICREISAMTESLRSVASTSEDRDACSSLNLALLFGHALQRHNRSQGRGAWQSDGPGSACRPRGSATGVGLLVVPHRAFGPRASPSPYKRRGSPTQGTRSSRLAVGLVALGTARSYVLHQPAPGGKRTLMRGK